MTYKSLFSRALSAAPGRLHFAAHSHHLWPDASFEAQQQTWLDANLHADHKWDLVFGQVIPEAQAHVAAELGLPSPDSIVFSSNTHDFLLRLFSGVETTPVRILATDGEFHSFRRQAERWEEVGAAVVTRVPLAPFDTFADRFVAEASRGGYDWIVVSQVFFRTGGLFDRIEELAALARPEGPWVLIDGYHGFMAVETDLSAHADRIFYTAGGYKYAMAGEGVAFLHCPPGFAPRPVNTGWYAEFDDLAAPPGAVGYAPDARRFLGSTFDPSGLYRFVAVRDMLAGEGLDTAAISAHADALKAQLLGGLRGPLADAELLNPAAPGQSQARFLALRHPDAARWQAALLARDIYTDVRGDVLRIGFGLYQTARDVEALLQEIAIL